MALAPAFAHAGTTIFADNFDSNVIPSVWTTNNAPSGWTVTQGTVDTQLPNNGWGLGCYGGVCVDLDGSTNQAGILSTSLNLTANTTYTASFWLSGNQRNAAADSVDVKFGTSTLALPEIPSGSPWQMYSIDFKPTVSGSFALSFHNQGGDNIGVLLDNVSVTAVPEPETYAMMLAGLGLLGFMAKRRKQA